MKRLFTLIVLTIICYFGVISQNNILVGSIEFQNGKETLLIDYKNNESQLSNIRTIISANKDAMLTIDNHIRLVSYIPSSQKDDLLTINMAALRASVLRAYLKKKFSLLTNWSFTFCIDANGDTSNRVDVVYVKSPISYDQSSEIYYCLDKTNISKIQQMLSRYKEIPFVSKKEENVDNYDYSSIIRTPALKNTEKSLDTARMSEEMKIVIYFRWDKHNLDTLYLNNSLHLSKLDSLLSLSSSRYIDSLRIVAYASPEGHPDYNKRLSERRAETIKRYILERHSNIPSSSIYLEPRGENWEGVRLFVDNDINLPNREDVIEILNSKISDIERQKRLTTLDKGRVYYRYILPNYYKYLRNGASIFIVYDTVMKLFMDKMRLKASKIPLPTIPDTLPILNKNVVKYPFAIRTNLLYDIIGAADIGLEFPIGNHFSLVADFTYGYWRSASNLYALQVLMGGAEFRYWFNVSDQRQAKNREWGKPLRGWNVGAYGMYCSRYDFQWIDGYQGDGFWSAGVSVGYAFPIAKNLSFEAGLGAGYLYTPEYRYYHRPEYDENGDYKLMWQETGSFSAFTLTKLKFSFIWMIQINKKGKEIK